MLKLSLSKAILLILFSIQFGMAQECNVMYCTVCSTNNTLSCNLCSDGSVLTQAPTGDYFCSTIQLNSNILIIVLVVCGAVAATCVIGCCICGYMKSKRQEELKDIYQLKRIASDGQLIRSSQLIAQSDEWKSQQPMNQKMKDSCCICLDEEVNTQIKCGHFYHANCLSNWLKIKISCPQCQNTDINPFKLYCCQCKSMYFERNMKLLQKIDQEALILCEKCKEGA